MGDTFEVDLKIKVEPELTAELGDSISQNVVNMVTRILQEYHAELLALSVRRFTKFNIHQTNRDNPGVEDQGW